MSLLFLRSLQEYLSASLQSPRRLHILWCHPLRVSVLPILSAQAPNLSLLRPLRLAHRMMPIIERPRPPRRRRRRLWKTCGREIDRNRTWHLLRRQPRNPTGKGVVPPHHGPARNPTLQIPILRKQRRRSDATPHRLVRRCPCLFSSDRRVTSAHVSSLLNTEDPTDPEVVRNLNRDR